MRRLTLALAAVALTTGLAAAQSDQTSAQERSQTELGADRTDKSGANQTYNTGTTGSGVGADTRQDAQGVGRDRNQDTARGDQYGRPGAEDNRGGGVATGFIAAGLGLALLGLFVRRRRRGGHYDRHDDINRPGGMSPRI